METKPTKIFILIPAFNEENSIAEVIKTLKKNGYNNIFVVNDGSKDKTAEVAHQAGAEVLSHIINRGQGAALQTGIEYLREVYNPDIIVTFDADGQHQADDIPKLIEPLLNNKTDIVLGSRFLGNECNIPFIRKLILRAGVIFTNILCGVTLTDTHNGFRALGRKAIDSIKISQRGMEHASNIIDEIKKKQLRYQEVPTEIIYSDYSIKKGTNRNIHFIKMGIKILLKKIL